jgi:hypothetical protein
VSLTLPTSFFAVAAGCVLPFSATRFVSSIASTIRTFGAALSAFAVIEIAAMARTKRGRLRSTRTIFIDFLSFLKRP